MLEAATCDAASAGRLKEASTANGTAKPPLPIFFDEMLLPKIDIAHSNSKPELAQSQNSGNEGNAVTPRLDLSPAPNPSTPISQFE